jgi:hypothetical protein
MPDVRSKRGALQIVQQAIGDLQKFIGEAKNADEKE